MTAGWPWVFRRETPFDDPQARFSAGKLGMRLFLLSLGVLFAASLVGYLAVRMMSPQWRPADAPGLPNLLWISSGVILVASASMQWALVCVRNDRQAAFRAAMLITCILAIGFLLSQTLAWITLIDERLDLEHLYAFTFYMLTGLHAAHVVGGLTALLIVARRGMLGIYDAEDHRAVHYTAMYWHFLGAVWIVLYGTLLLGS